MKDKARCLEGMRASGRASVCLLLRTGKYLSYVFPLPQRLGRSLALSDPIPNGNILIAGGMQNIS
jgi:hypothetical protein